VVRADVARLIRLAELGDGIGARARVVVAAGYRRLLAGAAGAPSRAESAYCTYALAVCRAMDGAWPEARTLLAAFDGDFARTPSQPRALYFRLKTLMGAATISAADEEVCRTDLARLLKDNADTHEADAALHCMAWVLASRGRLVEARGYFQDYVRRYPDGLWGAAAKTELAEVVAAIAAAPTEER